MALYKTKDAYSKNTSQITNRSSEQVCELCTKNLRLVYGKMRTVISFSVVLKTAGKLTHLAKGADSNGE